MDSILSTFWLERWFLLRCLCKFSQRSPLHGQPPSGHWSQHGRCINICRFLSCGRRNTVWQTGHAGTVCADTLRPILQRTGIANTCEASTSSTWLDDEPKGSRGVAFECTLSRVELTSWG